MRKDKRPAPKSGSQLQFGSQSPSSTALEDQRGTLWERWKVVKGGGGGGEGASSKEMTESSFSWPEDPETARFRPPSRSRPAQPCRRRAPSPPHLGGQGGTERGVCHDLGWWLATRTDPERAPDRPTKLLTWNHLDGRVDLLPVLNALKLPVQDEVAVISDHWTLRDRQTHTRSDDCSHDALWTLI